jgi:hypothetical protein
MATASVRGTVFDFDGVRLQVEEGRVYLAGTNAAGAYVSTGHTAEGETGRIAGAIDSIKEELSPALPAGVDTAAAAPAPAPVGASLGLRFDWSEE